MKRMNDPMLIKKEKKDLLFNILLLIISLIICLVVIEIILRNVIENNQCILYYSNNETVYKLKPNLTDILYKSYEMQYTFRTNSFGFRDDEFEMETDKTKIQCLGDSFTFGVGVEENDTFCRKLQDKLNNKSKGSVTFNMGVGGYSTTQEINLFYEYYNLTKPDMVILAFFQNDVDDDIKLSHNNYSLFCIEGKREGIMLITLTKGYITKNILMRTQVKNVLYRFRTLLVKSGLLKPKMYYTTFNKEYDVETEGQFKTNLEMIEEMNIFLKSQNKKLFILIIPDKLQVNNQLWDNYLKLNRFNPAEYDSKKPITIMEKFCEEKGIICINLIDAFAGKEDLYYRDDLHFTKKGHENAAEAIAELIISGNDSYLKT